ncbi:hypothetical protein B0E52_16845 [Rhodanobacter sp. C06]|nr:hypothetical protein B0E52_16845 [Rhodanobacter sp. C06]
MQSIAAKATHATMWSALEILARYGVQIAVTIVLARLLTPTDFGLIAMLIVFTSVGVLLVDSGFGTALIQRQGITADDETTVFAYSMTIGAAAGFALWFAAPHIAAFYHQPQLVPLTRLVAWVLPLGALAAVPDALLTKRLDFAARAHAEIVASGISGFVAVALALNGFGVWSIAWQSVIAIGLRATLLWLYARWKPVGRVNHASFRRLFGFGGFMLLAQLLDTVYVRAQALLLGRLFDAATLGYYTLAQNAQQAPVGFVGTVLSRVGLPVFSELSGEPVRLRQALRLSLRVSLFLFLPCMIGLALAAKPLIALVYGARWLSAAPVLTLLALAAAPWPLHVLNLAALTACGRSDLLLRLELFKKPVSIALVLVAAPFGPIAVAAAVLLGSMLSIAVNTYYSQRMLSYGVLEQIVDQKHTLLLCLASAVAGWGILHWSAPTIVATLTSILAAAVVYLGGAAIFRNPAATELTHLSRSALASRLPGNKDTQP